MNQTMEILIGISNQTGLQINELINMMTTFYVYHRIFDMGFLILFIILMSFSIYYIYNHMKKKYNTDKYFDAMDLFMSTFIPNMFIFLGLVFFLMALENCILGIMFPKEMMIDNIINHLL